MADLIQTNAQKSDAKPRNAQEARILAARASFAAFDSQWGSAQKAAQPAGPANHLSAPGRSTMREAARQTIAKRADKLASLPARARRTAEPLAEGQKAFLGLVYERAQATGEAVNFTKAEAGSVMGLTPEAAGRTVDALVTAGLLAPRYNSLGGLAGYLPAILD